MTDEVATYPMVLVRWADAHCGVPGWLGMDEYDDDGECLISTIGFLVSEGKPGSKAGHVTLWQTINDGDGIHPFHIPAQMVRKVTLLVADDDEDSSPPELT